MLYIIVRLVLMCMIYFSDSFMKDFIIVIVFDDIGLWCS